VSIGNYIGCLSGNGLATGNLRVFYDFSASSGNCLFNSVFGSGEQVLGGFPLISKYPGIVVKTGSSSMGEVLSGQFSGDGLIRVSKAIPFSSFTAVIDFENNFCDSSSSSLARTLLSTNTTGISGFDLSINQANRLSVQYPVQDGSYRRHCSSYELSEQNTVFLSHSDQRMLMGFYDYELELYKYDVFLIPGYTESDNWHIGGAFSPLSLTTGFKGTIRNFALFSQDLLNNASPAECLYCSGVNWQESTGSYSIYGVGSFNFSTTSISGVTGYQQQLTTVPHPTGGTTTLAYESGVSGVVSSQDEITSTSNVTSTGYTFFSSPQVLYDYPAKLAFAERTILFSEPVPSGYLIEIYSYARPNRQLNIPVSNFGLDKLSYPNALLWQNGILNIEDIDYSLDGTTFAGVEIQGYDPTDVFTYNLTTGRLLVTEYSGVWERSRIILNSGTWDTEESGVISYWPPESQYVSSGDALLITGVSGLSPSGYDLYLNGKKLTDGYDYSMVLSGSSPVVAMSGEVLPDFTASLSLSGNLNVMGWPSGSPPTGVYDSIVPLLVFSETDSTQYVRHVFLTDAPLPSYLITGFSEEVWINGVKQARNYSYQNTYPCSPSSGLNSYSVNGLLVYNNETTYYNII